MSDRIEPSTHIDIKVVKVLLESRINEGMELTKNMKLPREWRDKEAHFLSKCREAVNNINEAIKIKEDNNNGTSNSFDKVNDNRKQAPVQNRKEEA